MDNLNSFSTLLVHDNVDEANRLVSLLRNADFIVNPNYAANAGELNRRIQERNWELVLAQFSAKTIPARNVIHQIRRLSKDIPVIFILDDFDFSTAVEAIKTGGADVAPVDEDQYFIQAVTRTLNNLDQRRKLRYWQRRFSESEDRFEGLILSSQDGIAIIQEGTYVHVNSAFANLFGYLDTDSLTLMPVFDTLSYDSQRKFKKYLKPLKENDAWDSEVIRFEGQRADETTMALRATLSQIDFHGEAALQLLVKKEHMQGGSQLSDLVGDTALVDVVADVSKIRLHDMVEGINSTIRRAVKSDEDALLFYLQVDQYQLQQKQFGIGSTEEGIVQLAHFLDSLIPESVLFGRLREDAFSLIIATNDREKGLALANRLVKETAAQIFNTSDASFTCTISAGITVIGEATPSADEALSSCLGAIADLSQSSEAGKAGNGVKLHEPVFNVSDTNVSSTDIERVGSQIVKKNLVDLAFQPVISLHGKSDELYEVLMRIQSDGFVDGEVPDDFVSRVFKTPIGKELDRLVISRALAQLAAKKQAAPQTRLCIHLSQFTIEDEKFISWLQRIMDSNDLAPADLIFQMREIDISSRLGKAAAMLDRLRNFGTGTGLTHYGLAINPLTIFSRIAVDYVKIDGVLSAKAQKDKKELEHLKEILKELKGDKHNITVPFIESATIIPVLWQSGVDFLQGHYIESPSAEMNFDFSQE